MKAEGVELLMYALAAIFVIVIGRVFFLWYYKIDERIAQMYETNRLLRKLVGEPDVKSNYLPNAPITPDAGVTPVDPDFKL